jgi:hypothetical protein
MDSGVFWLAAEGETDEGSGSALEIKAEQWQQNDQRQASFG